MSSDASYQGAAEALDALAWLDDDEAAALESLFGCDGDCAAAPHAQPRAASPTSPLSEHDSEGGSSGRASACTAAGVASPLRVPNASPPRTARLDGLRFLDAECARGCDKYAPVARAAAAAAGRRSALGQALGTAAKAGGRGGGTHARARLPTQVHRRAAAGI